jgi:hypothetical protein
MVYLRMSIGNLTPRRDIDYATAFATVRVVNGINHSLEISSLAIDKEDITYPMKCTGRCWMSRAIDVLFADGNQA